MHCAPSQLRPPRLPTSKIGSLPGDKPYKECDPLDDDYDEDGLDFIERPNWNLGEVHIMRQATPPYWGMARYFKFTNLKCFQYFHCHRITGLPYKHDGFWLATVQRFHPTTKASNWGGDAKFVMLP